MDIKTERRRKTIEQLEEQLISIRDEIWNQVEDGKISIDEGDQQLRIIYEEAYQQLIDEFGI